MDINFVSGDVINGPLHSNDAIMTCGSPTFNGKVTTSWQGSRHADQAVSPEHQRRVQREPDVRQRGDPKYADPLTMPPSNLAIKVKADKSLGGAGCLFTGPTSITLNAAGTMTVVSPFTKASAISTNNCAGGTLASPATQSLPANGVIYVQTVPADPADPNYSATCPNVQQLGAPAGTTVQHPLGYPQRYDITQYGCTDGDVFLKGTLKGRLTIAAENNIDIIGNVTYNGGVGGSDLLGLVANNYVEIYHPVGDCGSSASPCDNGSKVNSYYNLDDVAGGTHDLVQQPEHQHRDPVRQPFVPGAELPVR